MLGQAAVGADGATAAGTRASLVMEARPSM